MSILHNIVHLLFGVAGLALVKTADGARMVSRRRGVIYLVLGLYGLVTDEGEVPDLASGGNTRSRLNSVRCPSIE